MTAARERPHMLEVAPSVHAYIQPDGGWCLNNAGLIVGEDCTVLIDTAATERRTRALDAAVRRLAPQGPDLLVNTHFHGDHTFGNAYFKPRATIIAHENCARDQLAAGPALRELWPEVDWGRTPITAPDVTYRGEAVLHPGGHRVELFHPGPAHTAGDTVVWLPDSGVLFTGDVVWSATTPFCLMGSITGSLEVIGRLRELRPRVVVPGHGPVGGPELFDQTESYLTWLLEVAEEGVRAGRPALETARCADLGRFAALLDSERLVGNLHRAYAELAGLPPGAPIDVGSAFAEMVEFHGALPACHA
ncbi:MULTISPECIES: MBL fold metallo-hydrolase [Thermomonospora]|uniref:Beta-lactamase domain protein n=1 Tax=Thermomonospora curvata (strain ATCC 19995 / DSM 43183 / JCM 3096 / KCTC 9072 / NBRC 15933 / NCIMB 10081 / Henssen B9) TaxID=471852 RepID=D1A616_THECD|nr:MULTISPECIES: MBL fold metallo-hydrolase [Thermomonospora]ACY98311.1 beta-lactamase domain protein [Thermomonospora curvata DSM 43183]PKK13478.1 MAG: MBL fold metallo-hydrolase [Thermomonospora sp. CIF 1]